MVGQGDVEVGDAGLGGVGDVLGVVSGWVAAGEAAALATVVAAWGSSPRPAGSRMGVSASGRMVGSVSGGCVEGAVVEAALEVMASGVPVVLEYGVSDDVAWSVGLPCGGSMRVLVERVG